MGERSVVRTSHMKNIKFIVIVAIIISIPLSYYYGRSIWVPIYQQLAGKRSVDDIVQIYGADVDERLKPYFQKAGVNYPPNEITLLAIKSENRLELWVNENNKPQFIRDYPVQAASGVLGPKLREGDKQVPEGIYQLEYLNPNSSYHLSLKINYPNSFDQKYASIEGRDKPGTNIFIHGKSVSIGCLAMGDNVIEELFVLVAKIGISNVTVAIAPKDPRIAKIENTTEMTWVNNLYEDLSIFFKKYKKDV